MGTISKVMHVRAVGPGLLAEASKFRLFQRLLNMYPNLRKYLVILFGQGVAAGLNPWQIFSPAHVVWLKDADRFVKIYFFTLRQLATAFSFFVDFYNQLLF